MARVQIDFREDFKLQVTLLELNPDYDPETPIGVGNEQYIIVDPTTVPFVINLFSLEDDKKVKSTIFKATWDLTTATNFVFDEVNTAILVIFDNKDLRPLDKGVFKVGQLQGTLWFGYPDSQMPDDTFNCGQPFDTNIDIINIDLVDEYESQVIKREAPVVQVGHVVTIVGKDGSLIYTEAGVPSNSLGVYTDLYIDTVAPNNFYQKNASNVWVLKGSLKGIDGDDGREVLIQNNGTYIQWQYEGDTEWDNIVELSTLKGDTGANIELNKSATHIQWRVVGDTNWIDLVALVDLKGEDGYTPQKGLDYFDGRGIVSFELIDTQEKTKTYRMLFTDATYVDIPIIDGNDGVDGLTPYIGINGNWWIGDVDQNIKAEGVDGISPTIGLNGNWYLGAVDTGVKAQGQDGHTPIKGVDYFDGITPTIGENKHWFIGAIDTGIVAEGKDGEDGVTPIITIGENENWYINGVDSGKPSRGDNGTSAYEIYIGCGGTLSEVDFNESITDIPTHIEDATKHIDTATAEFSGAIDETNDKFTIWDNSLLKWIRFSFASLKTFIGTYFLKLDQTTPQTIQGLLQNQSTAALESAPLSNELLTSENWTTTDWTGDFATGFTHTTGNVTSLTNILAALNNTLYQIAFTVTNRTAGSFTIIFGNETSDTYTASNAWGVRTTGTGTLSIVPTTDFNGTIVISIKSITGVYNPTYQILDSTGISTLEIRSSLNTLNNTFIGKGAGIYNTTGSQNSAQGVNALRNNTTGSNNSAQGVNALRNNTTGSNNTAQGVYALYSNTTGYNNSAQGVDALRNNTTGSDNSAQGVNALRNNTTGSNNTAQGVYALYSNTTGYNNSAQGAFTLFNNTTGSDNSAQGVNALYSNTTGYNNSAQGAYTLFNNTTGYNNSAQGAYTLFNNTTGSYNSAQGVNAGRYLADGVTGNQTSNNSVFLGANTKSKQAGQTNEIVIGANAVGNGSNTATIGHTNVTDVYLRGKGHFTGSVQIGDDTAAASVANEFAIRGRKGINGNIGFSVTEMCMPTDVGTWNWVEIVRNEWIIP